MGAGENITLQSEVARELLPNEADENIAELDKRTKSGWRDLTSHLTIEGVPTANAPEYMQFAPSGLRQQLAFEVGDYAFCTVFHANHDVKRGGDAYIHIHWSTDGTATESVKWEFQISFAKGHDQEYFGAEQSFFVEQQPNQVGNGAWRHYITETENPMVMQEPDTIALVTVRRVSNGVVDNADKVFGLICDFHYESEGYSTPQKAPDFYVED